MRRSQNRLLLVAVLAGILSFSGFSFIEVQQPSVATNKAPAYILALNSLTERYLQKDIPPHNRLRNLHELLVGRLKKVGIDTVLYYQSGCVGCEALPDLNAIDKPSKNCQCNEEELTVYLFWRYKGKTLSKKLDCCQNQPVMAGKGSIIDFYFQNKTHFIAGEKFFQDFVAYNRSHPNAIKFLPPTSIHDDVVHVMFYLGRKTIQFQVRGDEFTTAGNPKHMHYTWKRKQWEWMKLIEKAVAGK
ncbi:hypothetical protein J0X19_06025 [Hymenobacter sp. BT186]|uniref:Uncharacterized protein n=1 Tax=Hymenobacter telluris TaxID=2816474 RepID=A0A939EU05_9BACT|nr:hypothetical protein [Hymenobacter telluris]MBO0357495.1 hypothetical protein [Hymenobacter telluris]MBW3373521.1 hypothetical protein [Hymenobacter norwichensis]